MTIRKKRIRSLKSNFPHLEQEKPVYFGVPVNLVDDQQLKKAGFEVPANEGDSVLPRAYGSVSSFNANGKEIVRKDLPKEVRVVNTIEWHWKLWDGTPMSRWVDVTRECYQRKLLSPPSIELTIAKSGDGALVIFTPKFVTGGSLESEMVHAVNLLLELFGSATAYNEELEGIVFTPTRRLNWRVLPKGKLAWQQLQPQLTHLINRAPRGNRLFIEKRLHEISGKKPSFCAVGDNGYSGYVIFGFEGKGVFVLESIFYGNATYVFGDNWEKLSKMTKAEIINGGLEKYRIVHSQAWSEKMSDMFNKEGF